MIMIINTIIITKYVFIGSIKIVSSTILYSSQCISSKLIKLFYKIFKKVVAIDFDCVIICSSKANKLNKNSLT